MFHLSFKTSTVACSVFFSPLSTRANVLKSELRNGSKAVYYYYSTFFGTQARKKMVETGDD